MPSARPAVGRVSPSMASAVERYKNTQARQRPTADFAAQLDKARSQTIERRAQRQKAVNRPVATPNAFDPDRPLGGVRDDWAKPAKSSAGRASSLPTVIPPPARPARPVHGAVPSASARAEAAARAPRPSAAGRIPSAPAMPRSAASAAMDLAAYPRPLDDNGRGLHWIPTTSSSNGAVDRFVGEAKSMHASWVVFLNEGASVGTNDYLVKKLVEAGIEPIMRIYQPDVGPVGGDVEGMVRHYKALGVDYFQIMNEPNLRDENGGAAPNVDRYLDHWIPAARKIAAAGGLPGFGALSPNGDVDDVQFLRDALAGLKTRGALDTLDRGWLALHNYTQGRPLNADTDGFLSFRQYDQLVRSTLGRSIPIVGTEGGTVNGDRGTDVSAMKYMDAPHEPYFFANTLWVIANQAGGGHDPQWEKHALIREGSTSPVVDALRSLA